MKIINLQAENIKKLTAVEIAPDGNMVVISGKNGAGKSSVLDAIYWALAGTKNIDARPIRDGEETARIRLDLGELIVTRQFNANSTRLVVTSADGAKFPSPQKMLDELIGAIAFDPLEFAAMKPKEQLRQLQELAAVEIDFEDVEQQNKIDYDERTRFHREAKALEAQINALAPQVAGLAEPKKLDIGELADKFAQAKSRVQEAEALKERIHHAQAESVKALEEVERLHEALAKAEKEAESWPARIEELAAELKALKPPTEARLQKMVEYIRGAEEHNERVSTLERLASMEEDLNHIHLLADACTEAIKRRNESVREAIEAAKLPVDGLQLRPDGVYYQEIPFAQVNDALKLRVSTAVAMAMNPKLRVIRIKNGALLDQDGLKVLSELASAEDFQVWIERVGHEPMSFYIEDGALAEAASEAEPASNPNALFELPAQSGYGTV